MAPDYDEVESAVLELLREGKRMGFNQLLETLRGQGLNVSRPKLSRRLKSLVDAEVVAKNTVPGWPPSTRYSLTDQTTHRPNPVAKPPVDPSMSLGGFRAITALLCLGLLTSIAALCWHCGSLQTDLSLRERELICLLLGGLMEEIDMLEENDTAQLEHLTAQITGLQIRPNEEGLELELAGRAGSKIVKVIYAQSTKLRTPQAQSQCDLLILSCASRRFPRQDLH
jgi:DNA-binding transcriptional ArsR family regulator